MFCISQLILWQCALVECFGDVKQHYWQSIKHESGFFSCIHGYHPSEISQILIFHRFDRSYFFILALVSCLWHCLWSLGVSSSLLLLLVCGMLSNQALLRLNIHRNYEPPAAPFSSDHHVSRSIICIIFHYFSSSVEAFLSICFFCDGFDSFVPWFFHFPAWFHRITSKWMKNPI